jgi:RsiW-degrading membrane proteinase PrsW (M82 family)
LITVTGAFLGKPAVLVLVNVGSVCIALAFLGVTLSLSVILRQSDKSVSALTWVLIGTAMIGSLLILLAMLIPQSPVAFPLNSYEWPILAALSAIGGVVWVLSGRQRSSITEAERTRLILDEQTGND